MGVASGTRGVEAVREFGAVGEQRCDSLPLHPSDERRDRRCEQLVRQRELEGVAQCQLCFGGIFTTAGDPRRKDVDAVVVRSCRPTLQDQVSQQPKRCDVKESRLKVVLADSEIPKLQSLSFCGVDRSPDPTYLLVEGPESEVMD